MVHRRNMYDEFLCAIRDITYTWTRLGNISVEESETIFATHRSKLYKIYKKDRIARFCRNRNDTDMV